MIQNPLKAEDLKDRYDGIVGWMFHRRRDGVLFSADYFSLHEMDMSKSWQCTCIPKLSLIF